MLVVSSVCTDGWIIKKKFNKNRSHCFNGWYKYGTHLKENIWGDLGANWGVERDKGQDASRVDIFSCVGIFAVTEEGSSSLGFPQSSEGQWWKVAICPLGQSPDQERSYRNKMITLIKYDKYLWFALRKFWGSDKCILRRHSSWKKKIKETKILPVLNPGWIPQLQALVF